MKGFLIGFGLCFILLAPYSFKQPANALDITATNVTVRDLIAGCIIIGLTSRGTQIDPKQLWKDADKLMTAR